MAQAKQVTDLVANRLIKAIVAVVVRRFTGQCTSLGNLGATTGKR